MHTIVTNLFGMTCKWTSVQAMKVCMKRSHLDLCFTIMDYFRPTMLSGLLGKHIFSTHISSNIIYNQYHTFKKVLTTPALSALFYVLQREKHTKSHFCPRHCLYLRRQPPTCYASPYVSLYLSCHLTMIRHHPTLSWEIEWIYWSTDNNKNATDAPP